ncbi:methyltransferase [Enemella dayhoffiae]|uniref:Methyltransferase n=1 Tax=Enemella dayhoffiae TaxID=2016507 RepID=A0A255H3Y8_9ACTN|nr:class I SAM-dependent methyltransferase [Enemella dayhoffiae]OYO22445.1 methyltransferase [Enemella dayhoffiae]
MNATQPASSNPRSASGRGKNSAPAPRAASWAYAEEFSPEPTGAADARIEAGALGVTPLSRGTASLITVLARSVQARAVVEIGTSAGVSGLAFFDGMGDQGILTSVDPEHEHQSAARKAFTAAGIPNRRFRLITGQPLDVLPKLSDGAYDMVWVSGDKLEYGEYIDQATRLLRHGGLLLVHNALWSNKIADANNTENETIVIRETLAGISEDESLTATLVPVGDGLLLAVKA